MTHRRNRPICYKPRIAPNCSLLIFQVLVCPRIEKLESWNHLLKNPSSTCRNSNTRRKRNCTSSITMTEHFKQLRRHRIQNIRQITLLTPISMSDEPTPTNEAAMAKQATRSDQLITIITIRAHTINITTSYISRNTPSKIYKMEKSDFTTCTISHVQGPETQDVQ